MWRCLEGTGEIRGAESAVGLGTQSTNVEERRSKLRGS